MATTNFTVKNGLTVGTVEVANSTGGINAAAITAGTGVTTNATGIHIGQAVGTGDSVTFNNVDVDGDLRDATNRVFKVYNQSGTVVWGD